MNGRQADQSLEQRVARLQGDLAELVQVVVAGLEQRLSPYGIDAVEYTILYTCFTAKQITVKELNDILPIDYGRISRVVSRLERRGLVEKTRFRSDQRIVYVGMTAEGLALTPTLVKYAQEYYALLVRGIDYVEMDDCIAVMERMIVAGESTYEQGRG